MKLSIPDIAFEGFRVVRDQPTALAAWVLLQFLGLLAIEPGKFMVDGALDRYRKLGFVEAISRGAQPPPRAS